MSADTKGTTTAEVRVLGQRVVLKSAAAPEMVREAVELAQMKIKDAEGRAKGQAAHLVAVMALLDMAEEYVKARGRAAEQRKRFTEKSTQLLKMIDEQRPDN